MHYFASLHADHYKSMQKGAWGKQAFDAVLGQLTANKHKVADARRQKKGVRNIEDSMQCTRIVLDHDILHVMQQI